nr:septum formation protein Maf [Nanoarchaeum sp.]
MKIILATTSSYRQEAFKSLNLDFTSEGSDVEEYFDGRPESPEDLVKELSKLKAEAVREKHTQGIVIGFDSVGYFKEEVLEKPKSRKEAYDRLKALSGNNHQFYTGIFMINLGSGKTLSRAVKTEVHMRALGDKEINKYLDEDLNFRTYALGYDPLGNYSSSFVKRIEGSYNNLIRGIPLEEIVEMLHEIGFSW